jgi:tetratricopeptide (TPR) repeat protein
MNPCLAARRNAARRHALLGFVLLLVGAGLGAARAAPPVPPPVESPPPVPDAIRAAVGRGDVARALELIRAEIAAHPDSREAVPLRVLEGRLLAEHGDREGARAALHAVVADSAWGGLALEELHALAIARGEFTRAESLRTGPDAARRPALAARLAASAAWTRGELRRAEREIANADANDIPAILLRGNLAVLRGRTDEADKHFDRVISGSKEGRVRALAHFGKAQCARLRVSPAVRVLEDDRAFSEFPLAWALLDAGHALSELGRDEEAGSRYSRAIETGPPSDVLARLALARLKENSGARDEAKNLLAESITGGIGSPLGMARLGALLVREGREEDGLALLRAAHEALPELGEIGTMLDRVELRGIGGTSDSTRDELVRGVEVRMLDGRLALLDLLVEPDSVSLEHPKRFLRAMEHLLAGHAPAAIAWTEGAGPETPGLLLVRAMSFEEVDRSSEALAALEILAEAGRATWLAEEHRAKLLAATDSVGAAQVARRLLASHTNDPRLCARIAKMREKWGDLDGAIEALRKVRTAGWLTESEHVRLRNRLDDLEDLVRSSGAPDPFDEAAPQAEAR